MKKQEVLQALPRLSAADLKEIQGRIKFLLGKEVSILTSSDWLLDGLTHELRTRGVWSGKTFPAKLLPPNYSQQAEAVRAHLLKGFRKQPTAVECVALGRVVATLLVEYLERAKVPLSPKAVLLNVDKIPAAVENAFPGYWPHSLLRFCIKS